MEKLIIIGSGPAGMTAAIYAARARLEPLVAAGVTWGGLLMWTTEVENYPGWPEGIMGPELMSNMKKQAERFGAKFELKDATEVDLSSKPYKVKIGQDWVETEAIIVATGTKPRTLNLPREKEMIGHGLSVCATCDGAFFKDKEVIVVGGGDSAMEEAHFLTKFASKVTVIIRGDKAKASKIMFERVNGDEKVEIIYNTDVVEYLGEKNLEGVKLVNNQTNEESELSAQGLFFAIGQMPASQLFKDVLEVDEKGYLVPTERTMSKIPGVFIAGDVEDWYYRQAITASGDGCKAAIDAIRYLQSEAVNTN